MASIWPLLFVAVNHRRVTTVSDAQYGTFAVVLCVLVLLLSLMTRHLYFIA
jgi:hypothetical protein